MTIRIQSKVNNWKNLRDYSNQELYQFLEENELEDAIVLSCICSEILRRTMDKDLKIKEINEK